VTPAATPQLLGTKGSRQPDRIASECHTQTALWNPRPADRLSPLAGSPTSATHSGPKHEVVAQGGSNQAIRDADLASRRDSRNGRTAQSFGPSGATRGWRGRLDGAQRDLPHRQVRCRPNNKTSALPERSRACDTAETSSAPQIAVSAAELREEFLRKFLHGRGASPAIGARPVELIASLVRQDRDGLTGSAEQRSTPRSSSQSPCGTILARHAVPEPVERKARTWCGSAARWRVAFG